MDIALFGETDRDVKGQIKADYPAFFFDPQVEELRETIKEREDAADDPAIPRKERNFAKLRLGQERERLNKIENARPDIGDEERDFIAMVVKKIGKIYADSGVLPTYTQLDKRLFDARKIAMLTDQPEIEASGDPDVVSWLRSCNRKINEKGKTSGTDLAIAWKTGQKILGECTNIEMLRRK